MGVGRYFWWLRKQQKLVPFKHRDPQGCSAPWGRTMAMGEVEEGVYGLGEACGMETIGTSAFWGSPPLRVPVCNFQV